MRIYLAGPMRGIPEDNRAAFSDAARTLRNSGHVVFNPCDNGVPDGGIRNNMAMDTSWICLSAEAIALLPGWAQSRGALAEFYLAEAVGIPAKDWKEFL